MELPFLYCTRTVLGFSRLSKPYKPPNLSRKARALATSSGCRSQALEETKSEVPLTFLQQKAQESAVKKGQSVPIFSADETRAFYDILQRKPKPTRAPTDSASRSRPRNVNDTDHTNILDMFTNFQIRPPRSMSDSSSRSLAHDPASSTLSNHYVMRSIDLHNVARSKEIQDLAQKYLAEAAGDENVQNLETTIDDFTSKQMKVIATAFDNALNKEGLAGDLAVWKVLTRHVFPLVNLLPLNDLHHRVHNESLTQSPLSTKGLKLNTEPTRELGNQASQNTLAQQVTDPIPSKDAPVHPSQDDASQDNTAWQETETVPPKDIKSQITARSSKAVFSPEIFAIPSTIPALPVISRLYPASLLLALRLLIKHFPTSSFPAALLSQIRGLGPASYVLGANTHFYNTFLAFKYDVYSKVSEINGLLSEMGRGGVEMDLTTYQLLERIEAEREADMKARSVEYGSRGKAWWQRPSQMRGMQKLAEWKELLGRRLQEKASSLESYRNVPLYMIEGDDAAHRERFLE